MLFLHFFFSLLACIQPSAQITYVCNSNTVCGCSKNSASVTKIVGGETAPINTWGWVVSLLINEEWLCGGTILSNSWILTAAHCVENINPSQVIISAATDQLLGMKQWRQGSSVILHPQYNDTLLQNDIALIQVSPSFNMTDESISKICLPISTTEDYPPINSTLVAIGWGELQENGTISDTLQQVTLKRIQYDSFACYLLINNETMQFCAGDLNGGKDTCNGDSGGPLMMFTSSQQWVVVGITSYGYGCARAYLPGVYTRVAYYLDWIRSMNVTGAITVDIVTTTTMATSSIMNMIATLTDNRSNSTNGSLSCYPFFYTLYIIAPILFYFILILS
ncbi:unnamed protein product [Rotaria sp. Silwood2]|nr:unnamed protein product [Rotaria sp. Silwood2]CAF2713189.1 unnamed protein product [Rotaria sp. Silwood2]CAF2972625.1 unnamed protein product [Rotaria sp. Silwood2]CAF3124986.1 unnamed protein product [Rotaria sp. Silwood2]CAF4219059.1 unnamed protein product [Rotaria sp. Silwood2]